ncbi:MAG: helix-turn-helix domain-containing protein [Clostridia bacterium]|nr:helix-turn-helix domain-containing protein [Clostridia bacterium]
MSKYQKGNYFQVPNAIAEAGLSIGARGLYDHLKYLESRFNQDKGFTHTDEQLADELKTCDKTIRKYRNELINAGFIKWTQEHFITKDGKKSCQKVGCFEFINENNAIKIPPKDKTPNSKTNTPKCNFTEREYNRENLEKELFARSRIS